MKNLTTLPQSIYQLKKRYVKRGYGIIISVQLTALPTSSPNRQGLELHIQNGGWRNHLYKTAKVL